MADLIFPLDVEYASDDEFIEAGPMAELLFIRAGCFIKRKKLDGRLRKSQLPLVAANIPNPKRHASTLVDVGLWVDEGDAWSVPSYLKHNKSKAEIEAQREIQRESGERGNHERWHVNGEDGPKPSPKCRYCIEERMERGSQT